MLTAQNKNGYFTISIVKAGITIALGQFLNGEALYLWNKTNINKTIFKK